MSSNLEPKQSKGTHENGVAVDAELARARVAELLDDVTVGNDKGARRTLLGGRGAGERESAKEVLPSLPAVGDRHESNGHDGSDSDETLTNEVSAIDVDIDHAINPSKVKLSAVKIKGRPGGVAIEIGEGPWPELMRMLADRLSAAEGFFRGGRVVLNVGPRLLREPELREVCAILEVHDMKLGVVRSTVERTLQAALELGLSTSAEEAEAPVETVEPHEVAGLPHQQAAKSVHFVHRGHLRSGQILKRSESVVVIGDVNPGAQVISGGDIVIWGKLRGFAYAGSEGNRRAIVAALEFSPTQLRIAHLAAVAPSDQKKPSRGIWLWRKQSAKRPEVAYISEGRILVEPWEEAKSSGPSVLRR